MPLAPSRPKSPTPYTGALPPLLWEVLRVSWEEGLSIQSNRAREWAPFVALAASMGWISNVALDGSHYLRTWNITLEGTMAYNSRGR